MTIKQALNKAVEKLKLFKIKNSHLDAEILLSYILKKPREYILAHPEEKLTKSQISNIQYLISRRNKNEPIAYLTGHKQFYGLDFLVNKHVMIPRPETELMVGEAINQITHNMKNLTFIDVGTGSGCIIITIAKLLQATSYKLQANFLATDISKPALTIARKNAKLHKIDKKITFYQDNLLKPVINKLSNVNCQMPARQYQPMAGGSIVITANLPYLTPAQIKNSPTIKYEPKLALDAGPDGLKYYRQLFKQIHKLQIADLPASRFRSKRWQAGCRLQIIIEIDPSQTIKIKQLAKKELFTHYSISEGGTKSKIQIKKDLSGLNRLIIITYNI